MHQDTESNCVGLGNRCSAPVQLHSHGLRVTLLELAPSILSVYQAFVTEDASHELSASGP